MSGEYGGGVCRGSNRNPVPRNGTIIGPSKTPSQLTIDESLLVDPKLLFIGSKIGEGAHGKVYEGRYRDRIVAIKVLNRGSTFDEKAVLESRFIREVNMMSRVKHENLVKFIGACKDPLMVIVTELLPGLSLRKYLTSLRPKQLELDVVLSYALDIARAMDCLHANGIIHRDLKPDNLLLTANQKSVKLADFGLAREETLTEMMTAETGTYRWMAPELYSTVTLRQGEKKHYNNRVDVYSFGIVLWELLTNRMPFEGMSNLQAAYAAAFKIFNDFGNVMNCSKRGLLSLKTFPQILASSCNLAGSRTLTYGLASARLFVCSTLLSLPSLHHHYHLHQSRHLSLTTIRQLQQVTAQLQNSHLEQRVNFLSFANSLLLLRGQGTCNDTVIFESNKSKLMCNI